MKAPKTLNLIPKSFALYVRTLGGTGASAADTYSYLGKIFTLGAAASQARELKLS